MAIRARSSLVAVNHNGGLFWAALVLVVITSTAIFIVHRDDPTPQSALGTAPQGPLGSETPPKKTVPSGRRQIGKSARGGVALTYRSLLGGKPGAMSAEALPNSGRLWEPGDLKEEEALRELAAKLRAGPAKEHALSILDAAFATPSRGILEVVEAALKHPSGEVRLSAVERVGEFSDAAGVAPLLERALGDPDTEVRLAALAGAARQGGAATVGLLSGALENDSLDVRQNALDLASQLHPEEHQKLLAKAVASPYEDVGKIALLSVEPVLSKSQVDRFFVALDSPFPAVQAEARILFETRFLQGFATSQAARDWWTKNESRFDDNLAEVLPNPALIAPHVARP